MSWTLPVSMTRALATALIGTVFAAAQWTPQTSGVDVRLRGVSAVSERIAWASGANGTVLRTIDGGATWLVRNPPDAAKLDFRDVDAISEHVAYVLSIGTGDASRIYKTRDGGETWELQFANPDPKAFFDAMAFWDANRGVAFSDSVDGRFVIITTRDGGRTWARVPHDALPPALPNEGAFAASGTNVAVHGRDHVWIATGAAEKSRVLRSSDGGRTWALSDTPLASGPSSGAFSIAFRDALHGVVAGGDYKTEGEALDNAAVTSDGGATWTLVGSRGASLAAEAQSAKAAGPGSQGLSGFRSVVAPVPGAPRAWIAIGPSGADISTDDGHSWRKLEGPGFHTFSFARRRAVGWGAGERGAIAKLAWPLTFALNLGFAGRRPWTT